MQRPVLQRPVLRVLREYLKKAGFRRVETHQLKHDIQNNWYVVRK